MPLSLTRCRFTLVDRSPPRRLRPLRGACARARGIPYTFYCTAFDHRPFKVDNSCTIDVWHNQRCYGGPRGRGGRSWGSTTRRSGGEISVPRNLRTRRVYKWGAIRLPQFLVPVSAWARALDFAAPRRRPLQCVSRRARAERSGCAHTDIARYAMCLAMTGASSK